MNEEIMIKLIAVLGTLMILMCFIMDYLIVKIKENLNKRKYINNNDINVNNIVNNKVKSRNRKVA